MTILKKMEADLREIANAKQEKAWCDRNCETFGELVDRLQSMAKKSLREYEAVKDRVVVVPREPTGKMLDARDAEYALWGSRVNKGMDLPFEVFRHSSPEVVSPVVVDSFGTHNGAARFLMSERDKAAYKAMIQAAQEGE